MIYKRHLGKNWSRNVFLNVMFWARDMIKNVELRYLGKNLNNIFLDVKFYWARDFMIKKCWIALPRKKLIQQFLSRCQVLLGSRLLPQLCWRGPTCDGVLRWVHLLLCPRENRQRKLLLQCSKFRLKSGKIDSFNRTKFDFGDWKWSDLFKKYSVKYSGNLNTDHLNTRNIWILNFWKFGFQMVQFSNSQSKWFVQCSRPDIQIHKKLRWRPFKWHSNTWPFGILPLFGAYN